MDKKVKTSILEIRNMGHYYLDKNDNNKIVIFDNFNLNLVHNEFVSIVGHSGCGKTTLVNIIAGYIKPAVGDIIINGKKTISPGRDRIVINQENDLMDWMNVYNNMKLASKNEANIDKYLKLTNLSKFKDYYPCDLSGGMKKRLSLARALAADSEFIIMDEPFSSLDYQIKEKLQEELLRILKLSNKTILLVTHDIEEAIYLSSRVIVLGSSNPTIIKNNIDIVFPKDRQLSIKDSKEFFDIKNKIKHFIDRE